MSTPHQFLVKTLINFWLSRSPLRVANARRGDSVNKVINYLILYSEFGAGSPYIFPIYPLLSLIYSLKFYNNS
ncbi:MAG: hypothetical protein A3J63_04825 [Candidatus Moranbacteria bacterium RIFCSPHIGHO2_02_FULL_40_12b]|nr:MAG: hypothetical protein A3J63_04825 [Candidatus Moranbacteria bacterium RIFCSPHIGHO2_02_FULL_40_12b]OGI23076.1 MAG: hypothetical protein A3E91_00855 [Candidatus Moranbacteria bacterium RIFCSPHIGHO2_12_FULL_40_10]